MFDHSRKDFLEADQPSYSDDETSSLIVTCKLLRLKFINLFDNVYITFISDL